MRWLFSVVYIIVRVTCVPHFRNVTCGVRVMCVICVKQSVLQVYKFNLTSYTIARSRRHIRTCFLKVCAHWEMVALLQTIAPQGWHSSGLSSATAAAAALTSSLSHGAHINVNSDSCVWKLMRGKAAAATIDRAVLTANDGSQMDCLFVLRIWSSLSALMRMADICARARERRLFHKSNCAFAMHFMDQG